MHVHVVLMHEVTCLSVCAMTRYSNYYFCKVGKCSLSNNCLVAPAHMHTYSQTNTLSWFVLALFFLVSLAIFINRRATMKPILLNGHERPLTVVKYNREGDLIFTASKDKVPCVWFSRNGERLGTFHGHNGTIWGCDVDYRTQYFMTAGADNFLKIWDCQTGKCVRDIETKSGIRSCSFSYDATSIFLTTDTTRGQPCLINTYNLSQLLQEGGDPVPTKSLDLGKDSRVSAALWGPYDESIIAGRMNGKLLRWNLATGDVDHFSSGHIKEITDMQYGPDLHTFITSSKDCTARLIDTKQMRPIKAYETQRPVNSAAISPTHDYVVMGGGQDARDVTTTTAGQGKFEARFFHKIFEEELGQVKGHFGPINTIAYSPDGKGFASGGEDGFVRLQRFDKSYFEFEFET
eukprot:m.353875 g.353875  ORF g.353875 m.353875 type:complete len:405 (-) comp16852_c0_seq1:192-1406(-)